MNDLNDLQEIVSNLVLELRRGTIILCVLSQLKNKKYGYALVETLEEKGMHIDPGTLYPLLRRLEKQELLISEWETSGSKPRKYYILTEIGENIYRMLCEEWEKMGSNINELIKGE
ncbi:MAG: PadR family transcriptional regulator [Christensenellales bacterium]